jgi:hypothetical protein
METLKCYKVNGCQENHNWKNKRLTNMFFPTHVRG